MSSKKINPHYSGKSSKDFWRVVNGLKDAADHQELYSLGVALQNLEAYVLRQLVNVKRKAKP